jgi:hypothetical protein
MKKQLSPLFAVFVSITAFSQNDYMPGHIVNLSGDTLRGQIHNGKGQQNPLSIKFKKDTDPEIIYYPKNIKAFKVSEDSYISAVVDVDTSPIKISELTSSPNPIYLKDTVFLKVLVRGDKNLFFHQGKEGKTQFYIGDETIRALDYKQYVVNDDESSNYEKRVISNNSFRGQLISYLNGCPALKRKIETAKYSTNYFLKLFGEYQKCSQSNMFVSQVEKQKPEIGIRFGGTFSTFQPKPSVTTDHILGNSKFTNSLNPSFGLYANFNLTNRVSLSNDLLYTSLKFKGTGTYIHVATVEKVSSSFEYSYLKAQSHLKYSLNKKGNMYLSGGFTFGWVIIWKAKILAETSPTTTTEIPHTSSSFESGLLGCMGVRFSRISSELRFERSSGVLNAAALSIKTNRLYLLVGIRITK